MTHEFIVYRYEGPPERAQLTYVRHLYIEDEGGGPLTDEEIRKNVATLDTPYLTHGLYRVVPSNVHTDVVVHPPEVTLA
jgi:hypothetical protein